MIARVLAVSLIAGSSLVLTIGNAAADQSTPTRKLVYSFERSISQTSTVEAPSSLQSWQQEPDVKPKTAPEGSQPFPQSNTVAQNTSDEAPRNPADETSGTIEVDVLRQQADHGAVVSIREQSASVTVPAATCVVYANTALACGSNQQVTPEEYTLLRFMGQGFADPSKMDAQRHWRIAQSGSASDSTDDYQVVHDADGVLTIDETQTIGSKTNRALSVRTIIGYDSSRSLPTAIDERVIQNQQAGARAAHTVRTTLQLVSASP